jgi:hypothetical protein
LSQIQNVSIQIERTLADFPDTRSAFAERTTGGYFLDFTVDRSQTHHLLSLVELALGSGIIWPRKIPRPVSTARWPVSSRSGSCVQGRTLGRQRRVIANWSIRANMIDAETFSNLKPPSSPNLMARFTPVVSNDSETSQDLVFSAFDSSAARQSRWCVITHPRKASWSK